MNEKGGLEQLDRMFRPKTIAVIGASGKKGSVGHSLLANLIGNDFQGVVYPVNLKRESILGVKTYASIKDIPDRVDLAIIATPARAVPGVVEDCGEAGVSCLVIISAGFQEAGADGERMCSEILTTAKSYGMRILGPNCLGFINPSHHLNASFASKNALPGKIAFISQSGALCTAILDWSVHNNVGFSYFVSIGSQVDVGFHDLIDYFGQDRDTKSILIYMESLTNARKFLSAARAFARTKPIIILKAGKSNAGAQAAKSHTGSLAGDDAVYDAAFKRAGIIRVNTIEELFYSAQTLSMQPRPFGKRLAIITNAGGPGVIATDALIAEGGEIASLGGDTIQALNGFLPSAWSKGNPIDILGDADHERYRKAAEIVLKDPNVDGVLTILTPQSMTHPDLVAQELVKIDRNSKTFLSSWMGADDVEKGRHILLEGRIPDFPEPEKAVRTFMTMYNYSKNLVSLYETPATIPHAFTPKTDENKTLIRNIALTGRYTLTEAEAKKVLDNYGIPVTDSGIAHSGDEAVDLGRKLGFPIVMKVLSPDILHKTDVGGVKVGIETEQEARQAYQAIIDSCKSKMPQANIHGIFVEKMVRKKYEILIGCKKDRLFGPAIVFGMGGVAVEVFRDTKVGLPPLNMALAQRIIEDTKVYRLLEGYRGMEGVDIKSIQFLLYKFAYLVMDFPEIQEIDINPFGVDKEGGVVLDAKIILDPEACGKEQKPYSHLVISPYPKEYITKFNLKNGLEVTLRPIRPEDEPMEAEMFKLFSSETQRYRFFTLIKDITHELLVRYTQIDYDREIAIIAEVNDNGQKKMAGVVRIISDPYNDSGEFAIVVADPWQHQGLGNRFTDFILEIGKKQGMKKVFAVFLKDNIAMHNMFRKRKFTITQKDEDSMYAELELR